jgi:DNA-binding response OmpR family regulator
MLARSAIPVLACKLLARRVTMPHHLKLVSSDASNDHIVPRRAAVRILVAEDDASMRRVVADALCKQGYDVLEVADSTGQLAELVFQDLTSRNGIEPFDLILTDMCMPGCSGLSIIELLQEAHWSTPVILMTAFGDYETTARAKTMGAVLLEKPLRIGTLLAAVRACLKRGPADRRS